MTRLRLVVDTNVLVSALIFPGSIPERAFRAAVEQGEVLWSLETMNELAVVIRRPKFTRYVVEIERELFWERLASTATRVEIRERLRVCRDPKDDKFLELVVAGAADVLITGDADLLMLGRFQQTEVVTPAGLPERLGKSAGGP